MSAPHPVSIALLHDSVRDKKGRVSVTSVANADIHDIARCARTFGLRKFYIVTPILKQRILVEKIIDHWRYGYGRLYNPFRKEAFSLVDLRESLDDVIADMKDAFGKYPRIVLTGAGLTGTLLSCAELREKISKREEPYLILFGTGWGFSEQIFAKAHYFLEPVRGISDYNHLSVRSAAAIILDRLLGR
ncbi:MAG: RNA methyltransferase [Syntrophobacterales bacterium]|jgi:hypothetical protein|nr:RNA methyltransferase [Syntrophobacterales bacterium]